MNFLEKKRQLDELIKKAVLPLIDNDYVFYGLPYYSNVGDTLIWNGELELLKKSRQRCIEVCSWCGYPKRRLDDKIVILITGGGYFGDVWRRAWQEVLDGIRPNINNKIIIMPCSVWYDNELIRDEDAAYLSNFKNLTILVRDRASLEIVQKYFSNEVLLVPDMAFCMSEKQIKRFVCASAPTGVLYFKRRDKESVGEMTIPEQEYVEQDWLPMEHDDRCIRIFNRLLGYSYYLNRISPTFKLKAQHLLYRKIYRSHITSVGIRQLSQFDRIYTTRLHGMILGTMLGKDVRFIDNSYGKISSFYETWLSDCDNVRPFWVK